jgi:hypothetical protein
LQSPDGSPTSYVEKFVSGIRYRIRSHCARLSFYLSFASSGRHRDEVVRPDTAIVIDGFPRCANTFAAIAFQAAQPYPVKIAHHLHAPAHLIRGTKLDIPTMLLVREPVDTALSEAIRSHPVPLSQVLNAYCLFYESVVQYIDRIVVAEFRRVTTDFGSVIQSINTRFGTNFALFDHTPDKIQLVFGLIEQREKRLTVKLIDEYLAGRTTLDKVVSVFQDMDRQMVPSALHEDLVPRPSAARGSAKARLRSQLESRHFAPLLERAWSAYRAVASCN